MKRTPLDSVSRDAKQDIIQRRFREGTGKRKNDRNPKDHRVPLRTRRDQQFASAPNKSHCRTGKCNAKIGQTGAEHERRKNRCWSAQLPHRARIDRQRLEKKRRYNQKNRRYGQTSTPGGRRCISH
jgi:hypothetical protein